MQELQEQIAALEKQHQEALSACLCTDLGLNVHRVSDVTACVLNHRTVPWSAAAGMRPSGSEAAASS